MKNLIIALTMTMFVGFTTNQAAAQKKGNEIVCYKSNMDCVDCEKTITEYLKFEKGVKDLKVDHVTNTILVEYKTGKNSSEGFAKAIEKKGYKAGKISLEDYNEITGKDTHGHNHDHKHEEHKEQK